MNVGIALAAVAIVVSLLAAWVSLHAQRELLRAETVSGVFEGFRRVTELRIVHWQAAHLLETPENYDATASLLRTALAGVSPAENAELVVRERAVAIALLQIFEESVYQHEHAQRLRDRGRAAFLDDVLAYFTERLLLNPRLLYPWSPKGGNIRADFEPPTRAYYEAHLQIPAEARIDERPPWPTQTAGPTADRP